jgi:FixJ family two-component response regulator
MPGCDGLMLQKKIAGDGDRPIIFLSGEGTIPVSVRAMRAGAVDFLIKPVKGRDLLDAVGRAAARDAAQRQARNDRRSIQARVNSLSPREREVLTYVIAGWLNKQIAAQLGTVEKTIKVHRSRMMVKMSARTVVELVRLTEKIGLQPGPMSP